MTQDPKAVVTVQLTPGSGGVATKPKSNVAVPNRLMRWLLQPFTYTALSMIAMAIVYTHKSMRGADVMRWVLAFNAFLLLILSTASYLYKSKEVWQYWEGLLGPITGDSYKRFFMLLGSVAVQVLPAMLVMWLGWHADIPPQLMFSIAAVPVVLVSLYHSVVPIEKVYGVPGMKENAYGSIIVPSLVVYALCVIGARLIQK